jgi:hypothetical protein
MGRRAKTPYIQINLGDRFLSLTDRGKKEILGSPLGYFEITCSVGFPTRILP